MRHPSGDFASLKVGPERQERYPRHLVVEIDRSVADLAVVVEFLTVIGREHQQRLIEQAVCGEGVAGALGGGQPETQVRQAPGHLEAAAHRPLRIVFVGAGEPEVNQEPVAEILRNVAVVSIDDGTASRFFMMGGLPRRLRRGRPPIMKN